MKWFYGVLCVVGTIFPMSILFSWVMEFGLDLTLLLHHIMNTKIAAFAWADVLVSAVVLIGFIVIESKRVTMRRFWIPIISTCCVGVSLGLPLFLLMRELHLEKS